MAEADPNPQRPQKLADEQKLKYLGFVLVAVLHLFMVVAKLYSLLKDKLGPLKPGINAAESIVRSLAGPVWGKFHNVPIECLVFVDRKIDKSVKRVQRRVPKALRRVTRRAFKNSKKAPVAARSVMCDVANTGMVEAASELAKTVYANTNTGMVETASELAKTVYDKYEPVAKDIYSKYEPVTEQYASSAWHFLNQYTLFHRAVQNMSPIATHFNEKVASHLPLAPTEKIAKAPTDGNVEPAAEVTHEKGVAAQ